MTKAIDFRTADWRQRISWSVQKNETPPKNETPTFRVGLTENGWVSAMGVRELRLGA
jgi:hypothetical protein